MMSKNPNRTSSQLRRPQGNGCRHVGGLCLIDESQLAGACVQTCTRCGWVRKHGERYFSPPSQPEVKP